MRLEFEDELGIDVISGKELVKLHRRRNQMTDEQAQSRCRASMRTAISTLIVWARGWRRMSGLTTRGNHS